MNFGPNGNLLVGGKKHEVRCFNFDGEPIRTFGSLASAANWLVRIKLAASKNAAKVSVTHALNGKQHYYGKDHLCRSAYGMIWKNA